MNEHQTLAPTLPLNLTPQDILDAREMFDDELLAQESDLREGSPCGV